MEGQETCPLPEDPVLAEAAAALNDNGQWATIVDHRWRNAYMTDDLRLTFGGQLELVPFPVGAHFFGPEAVKASVRYRAGLNNVEFMRDVLTQIGPWVLADTPGGQRELLELVDPGLRDLVGGLSAGGPAVMMRCIGRGTHLRGQTVDVPITAVRLRDEKGRLAGTAMINKPAPPMRVLAALAAGEIYVTSRGCSRSPRRHVARPPSCSPILSPPRRWPGACPRLATSPSDAA